MAGVVVALCAAAAVAVAAAKPAVAQPENDHPAPSGILRVCSTGDYRPFTFEDGDGHWTGMDIDLAQDLAHRLGATAQFVPSTWSTLATDIGQICDVGMGGITVTAQRAEVALFSDPYLRDGKAAMVRCADVPRFRSLVDIDRPGVRVIVNPGGTNQQFDSAHLHQADIVEYADNNTIFDQLIVGLADVMITDVSEILWQQTQHPELCGVSTDDPFTDVQKAYLLPKTGAAMKQRVDQWLGEIRRDGSLAAISHRWLGEP